MKKRIIKICYRKVIDANSKTIWDKYVFEDSYKEFKMQVQLYNQDNKYHNFSQVLQYVPGSDKLHFLVSGSITGYLQQLNDVIPDVWNNLGKHCLNFKNYQFEIINSDINDISKHQVAITFLSESLIWHDTIDDMLLVSENREEDELLTHLIPMKPFLSIYSIKY